MLYKICSVTKNVYINKTKDFNIMPEHIQVMNISLCNLTYETIRSHAKMPKRLIKKLLKHQTNQKANC